MTRRAALFDMDRTLVDSEKLWYVALHELAARYGGTLSDAAPVALWSAAGAAADLAPGAPVALHERYHVLAVGRERFNIQR